MFKMIIARAVKGKEFLYNPKTAHRVSERSAKTICEILNRCSFKLSEGQIWHVYEADYYSEAYDYAETQRFTIRNGVVSRKYSYKFF